MKTMDLSFLQDVELEAVKKVAAKSRTSTPKLPTDADLRVFSNGRVYPSAKFVEAHNLEFKPKEVLDGGSEPTVVVGNGLEIFSSKDWGMIKGQLPEELLFCAPVEKALPKVDMWASTKYTEENEPKASVFTQGANTFAKDRLVPMIADIYGINWNETEYVDMTFVEDQVIASPNGLYHLPKIVSTGKHKGKADYIRRENLTICPLIVHSVKAKAPIDAPAENAPELDKKDSNGTTDPGADWAKDLGAKDKETTDKKEEAKA